MNCTVCTRVSDTQASTLDHAHKMPGHRLLAKLGKRVLRPGGLEPRRVVQDEGFFRALRFVCNVIRNREARHRVFSVRRMFRRNRRHLAAISFVAIKP